MAAIISFKPFEVLMDKLNDIMGGTATGADIDQMTTLMKKIAFVEEHHHNAIYLPKGDRKGWTTYVGKGKERKPVQRKTKEALYEYLYDYYHHGDLTVQDIFDQYLTFRTEVMDRSPKTIEADTCNFTRFADKEFRSQSFLKLKEDDWRRLIVKVLKSKDISQDGVKRFVLVARNLYDYAIRQRLCEVNEIKFIDYRDYFKSCKPMEYKEQIFTEEEEQRILRVLWERIDNPRAQMFLLSAETGMRIGELAALHWEDIGEESIHICRQQILDPNTAPQRYYEVNYTKDERQRIPIGRYFPITDNIREILDVCRKYQAKLNLDAPALHVFCDDIGAPIKKDTAGKFLKRICDDLGIEITRNHAFRKTLNSSVFEALGIEHQHRSYLMGHSPAINMTNYSCKRRENTEYIGKVLNDWNAKAKEKREKTALARSCELTR